MSKVVKNYLQFLEEFKIKFNNVLKERNFRVKTPDHKTLKLIAAAISEMQVNTLMDRARIDTLINDLFSENMKDFFDKELSSMTEKHRKNAYIYFKLFESLSEMRQRNHELIDIVAFLFSQIVNTGKTEEEAEMYNILAKSRSVEALILKLDIKDEIKFEGEPETLEWGNKADLLCSILSVYVTKENVTDDLSKNEKKFFNEILTAINNFYNNEKIIRRDFLRKLFGNFLK